ncbi:MAG: hypothetical protein KDA24_19225 [Deltaproteobacteria bacterium]|nr:hypothetical protein [Deltaproteobacteria bacterium]
MTDPTPDRLDALIAELLHQLDESSAGVRVTSEWKSIREVVEEHVASREATAADPDALDSAIRVLEAQRDMLFLAKDEVAEQERRGEQERARREREDKQIVAVVRKWLPPYSMLSVSSIVVTPFLGLPFGLWALVGAFPALFGFLEMRRRTDLMDGRNWVILNDEVREVESRVRMYHAISAVGVLFAVGWFLAVLLTGDMD